MRLKRLNIFPGSSVIAALYQFMHTDFAFIPAVDYEGSGEEYSGEESSGEESSGEETSGEESSGEDNSGDSESLTWSTAYNHR